MRILRLAMLQAHRAYCELKSMVSFEFGTLSSKFITGAAFKERGKTEVERFWQREGRPDEKPYMLQ